MLSRSDFVADLEVLLPVPSTSTPESHHPKILNIHGIAGIGKTNQVRQLFDRLSPHYTLVLLNFDLTNIDRQREQQGSWANLLGTLREHLAPLNILADQISLLEGEMVEPAELPIAYTTNALPEYPHRPLLMIFDALDEVPYWKWIQDQIIKPLIQQPDTHVVCVSRSPLFWHFWEIREQCTLREVPPLDWAETQDFLREYQRELLTETLYRITHGYPLALRRVMALLYDEPPATSGCHLGDLPTELHPSLLRSGLLRWIETPVMQALLVHFPPPGDIPPPFRILNELRAGKCLEPLAQGRPLSFVSAFRHEITTTLRATEPQLFEDICSFLVDHYAARVHERPITNLRAFNEWLYFSALLIAHRGDIQAEAAWVSRFNQLFQRAKLADLRLLVHIYADQEVLTLLAQIGQIDHLQAALHMHIVKEPTFISIIGRVDLPQFLATYQQDILQTLHNLISADTTDQSSDHAMPSRLPALIHDLAGFENFLSFAAVATEGIDIRFMQERLLQDVPGSVIQALAFLKSQGFFEMHDDPALRPRRRYLLHPLIQQLVAGVKQLVVGSTQTLSAAGSVAQTLDERV